MFPRFFLTLLIIGMGECSSSLAEESTLPQFQHPYSTYHGTSYEDTLKHTYETATNRKNYWYPGCQNFGFIQPLTDPFWYGDRLCRDFRQVTQNANGVQSTEVMRFCQDKQGAWQRASCF